MADSARRDAGPKERMLTSAALLLRERGMAGVTVDAVLADSGAPRGSVYHHFPGGRNELLLGALTSAGAFVSGRLERDLAGGDATRAVEGFVRFWKRTLTDSEFRAGCPVVAVAVDGRSDVPGAADAVQRIFADWEASFATVLASGGHSPARARRLATLVVAAIEGAVLLSRARRDVTPLDDVATELSCLLNPT